VILQHLAEKLRNLFRKNDLPKEAGERAARLGEKVLALVDNMPALPDTATQALELAKDPNSKFADFARLIEADAAIATGILRVANSALYAGGLPAVKLHQAVVRLGMRQCQSVIVTIGMRGLFRRVPGGTRRQCEVL
jgi:HD-like signal output (HDOD) protein